MIISVSRRTDIPALYSEWFMNRIKAGYCVTRNPYNPKQARRISLLPEDVDAFVFWSKNPKPFVQYLPELDRLGHRYYFQFTLNDYPRELEQGIPPIEARIETFKNLSEMLGKERVIWRYDPIILSNITDASYHLGRFEYLASELEGYTKRVMISIVSWYRKTAKNLASLHGSRYQFDELALEKGSTDSLLESLATIGKRHSMKMFACSIERDYHSIGIEKGRCVDTSLLTELWPELKGLSGKKDPGQRKECGCAVSRDIGVNNSCIHACGYCYATVNHEKAVLRYKQHDPQADELFPLLLPA